MKNTREWFNDAQWVEYGDGDGAYTAAYGSATSFTINGVDVSAIYHEGRRVKVMDLQQAQYLVQFQAHPFHQILQLMLHGTQDLYQDLFRVYIGALSKTNNSIPTGIIGTVTLVDGSVTTVKLADDAVTNAKDCRQCCSSITS